jgi:hypothetical protein
MESPELQIVPFLPYTPLSGMDAAAKKANAQPDVIPSVTSFALVKVKLPVQQRLQQATFLRKVEQVFSSSLMLFATLMCIFGM